MYLKARSLRGGNGGAGEQHDAASTRKTRAQPLGIATELVEPYDVKARSGRLVDEAQDAEVERRERASYGGTDEPGLAAS